MNILSSADLYGSLSFHQFAPKADVLYFQCDPTHTYLIFIGFALFILRVRCLGKNTPIVAE